MINVLVSGASGIVGYGILRSLRISNNFYLIGTSIHEDSAALLFCDVFEKAPLTSDNSYFEWLINIIIKHSVQFLIPGIECDMLEWNRNRALLQESGVKVILNNYTLIELCKDKWLFYEQLIKKYPEIAIPTVLSIKEINFESPIILKPRVGFGSKGIVRLNNKSEIKPYRNKIGKELMIQPVIGDDNNEFTISAFFDKDSILIDYLPLRRKLSPDGFTQIAEVVNNSFDDILIKLAAIFKPVGPTNFQFRLDGDNFKLLEINPRISSATSIRAKLGYNEAIMIIEYLHFNKTPKRVDLNNIFNFKAIRYIDEIILK
jgi:carbamoyl-phosphate synthase large subunit